MSKKMKKKVEKLEISLSLLQKALEEENEKRRVSFYHRLFGGSVIAIASLLIFLAAFQTGRFAGKRSGLRPQKEAYKEKAQPVLKYHTVELPLVEPNKEQADVKAFLERKKQAYWMNERCEQTRTPSPFTRGEQIIIPFPSMGVGQSRISQEKKPARKKWRGNRGGGPNASKMLTPFMSHPRIRM